ncbi:MAG TPA: AI-2E family transporter [Armatimonadota bacterium]|nr:AI-2E family transporter [Armatimonadota bacterium]
MVSRQNGECTGVIAASLWRKIGMVLLVVAAVLVGYYIFERFLRVAVMILLLAGMLTYLLQPVVEWLVRISKAKRLHAARTTATLLVYVAIAFAIFGMGAATVKTISRSAHDLQATWLSAQQHLPAQVVQARKWYERTVPKHIKAQIAVSAHKEMAKFSEKYVPTIVASMMGLAKTAGKWIALLIELIFVPLVAFYFLTDGSRVRAQTLFFVPKRYRYNVLKYAAEMDHILRQYIHGQLVLCAIAWGVVTIGLLLMGVPGALLLGIIAGIARGIPVVGPVIGGVPVLASILFDPQWAGAFWWVLVAFTALHFFESKFLMPRILGDHLGVHPVIVIISLLVGYQMLGLLGMFLAPPAIAMIRYVLAVRREEGALSEHKIPDDAKNYEPLSANESMEA